MSDDYISLLNKSRRQVQKYRNQIKLKHLAAYIQYTPVFHMIFACFLEATGFKSFPNKRTVTWQDFFVLHNLKKNFICVRDD